ncbi:MAG: tetratricopeptide repeat protein [Stappiaceae bacterium]
MSSLPISDDRGIAWTASSEATGSALMEAMSRYLTFRADALDTVDALLEKDPDCPVAWVLRGYLLLFARKAELVPEARNALQRAQALAPAALPRERRHIQALAAWCDAQTLNAQRIWDDILEEDPHDLLALRVQHFHALFLGRPDELARHATRTMHNWSDDIPGAGFAWSTACMGFEETDQFNEAERIGRRASELEPDDLWSLHSVAHVFEAEGRLKDGLDWMQRPAELWQGRGSMRHHLWWHEALFLYEAGAYDQVLDYYDRRLETTDTFSYLEMSNLSSLLYRLEAAGVACGTRWDRLAVRTVSLLPSRGLTFGDIHALIVFALAQDGEHLAQLSASMTDYAKGTQTYDTQAAQAIGIPVSQALQARNRGDARAAVTALNAARPAFARMGGSNAQRDMLDILLVDLAIDAGDTVLAGDAIARYLDIRPHSEPMRARLGVLAGM